MDKNLPANAGRMGSIPSLGGSHSSTEQLSPAATTTEPEPWSPCAAAPQGHAAEPVPHNKGSHREKSVRRSREQPPLAAARESPPQQRRPRATKKKKGSSVFLDTLGGQSSQGSLLWGGGLQLVFEEWPSHLSHGGYGLPRQGLCTRTYCQSQVSSTIKISREGNPSASRRSSLLSLRRLPARASILSGCHKSAD